MIRAKAHNLSILEGISRKLADYKLLVKLRLTSIVVFSAGVGYIFAVSGAFLWSDLFLLLLGGFLVTGASNAFNEILEKDTDKLMKRTADRPIPANRMSVTEAILLAGIMGVAGIFVLAFFFNTLAALVGAVSLLMYSFIYTPLKRISNIAVFVGAIPGALPPVIGWIAYSGSFDMGAMILFSIQFLWQFPHFWAIAWVADEDYKAAGFDLLPSADGKGRGTAFQTLLYIVFLIPVSLIPYIFDFSGFTSAVIILITGCAFLWQAVRLFNTCTTKAAMQLMFGSFLYLPIVFIALILDKI